MGWTATAKKIPCLFFSLGMTYTLYANAFMGTNAQDVSNGNTAPAISAEVPLASESSAPPKPPPVDECGLPLDPVLSGYDPILMKDYPELAPRVDRVNYCRPKKDSGPCKPRPKATVTENEVEEFKGFLKAKSGDISEMQRFHNSAAQSPFEDMYNVYSHITKIDGFYRNILSVKQIYSGAKDRYFHGSAGSFDDVNGEALEWELKQQERIREIAQEIFEKIPQAKEYDCQRKYMRQQIELIDKELASLKKAVSEIESQSATNWHWEGTMVSLPGMKDAFQIAKDSSEVTGSLPPGRRPASEGGDVSGDENLNPGSSAGGKFDSKATASKESSASISEEKNAQENAKQPLVELTLLDLLSQGKSNVPNSVKQSAASTSEEEPSLFLRVHRKHRQKEEAGTFVKGPLDGPRNEVLPGLDLRNYYGQSLPLP